jgi:Protein of unknown function (DUF551)
MEEVALWMIEHGYATGHGDTIADMLGELEAQAKEPPKWQPIVTAPKDGKDILACDSRVEDWFVIVAWDVEGAQQPYRWVTADGLGFRDISLTHWMPLPEPPR